MKKQYKIITATTYKELETLVNELLDKGYDCLGGICFSSDGSNDADAIWSQAMIKLQYNHKTETQIL